jgi:hypothetical protein
MRALEHAAFQGIEGGAGMEGTQAQSLGGADNPSERFLVHDMDSPIQDPENGTRFH